MTKSEFSKVIFDLKFNGDKNRLINESYDNFAEILPTELNKKFVYYIGLAKTISPVYIKTLIQTLLLETDRCTSCLSPLWIINNKSNDPYLCKSCMAKYDDRYSNVPKQEIKKRINHDDPLIKTLAKIRTRLELDEIERIWNDKAVEL